MGDQYRSQLMEKRLSVCRDAIAKAFKIGNAAAGWAVVPNRHAVPERFGKRDVDPNGPADAVRAVAPHQFGEHGTLHCMVERVSTNTGTMASWPSAGLKCAATRKNSRANCDTPSSARQCSTVRRMGRHN
jgi:hypothetical protein